MSTDLRDLSLHDVRAYLADFKEANPGSTRDDLVDAGAKWLDEQFKFRGIFEVWDGPAFKLLLGLLIDELYPALARAFKRLGEKHKANLAERKRRQAERQKERDRERAAKTPRPSREDASGRAFVVSGAAVQPADDDEG